MPGKGRVERLVSAGGVVYRPRLSGEVEVVLCGRRNPSLWALPKGTPDPGETLEQTALRETREETGLEVELRYPLESISYWFVRAPDGVRCFKRVHFYLMAAVGGSTSAHDPEFDLVQWFSGEEALQNMTYANERRVVARALTLVETENWREA